MSDPTQPGPGPTRERWAVDEFETNRIDGPNGQRVRCYRDNGTEFDPALARWMAAALNGRLPARPSPTDDDARWDVVAEAQIAYPAADGSLGRRLADALLYSLAEIERLRAHQGTA